MAITTVLAVIEQERPTSTDSQIATLLRASKIAPPKGHRSWDERAVIAVAGPRISVA